MKMSALKLNEVFTFAPGTKPKYLRDKSNSFSVLDQVDGIEFVVLQVNRVSVKCRMRQGFIEYCFRHTGCWANYYPATDYNVILTVSDGTE